MNLNINDFSYIVTIAELGSYRKAAEKLFITQSALSQRVKYIEAAYNVTLMKRSQMGARLTAEGEIFVKYAKEILASELKLRTELNSQQARKKNSIAFGVSHVYVDTFYQTFLPSMHEALPEMKFTVIERSSPTLQEQLISGEIDVALCFLSEPEYLLQFSYQIILSDAFVFLPAIGSDLQKKIAASYLPGTQIDPKLLDGESVATCIPGRFLHHYLDSLIKAEGISPLIQYVGESLQMLYSFVEKGFSSAVFYESYLRKMGIRDYYFLNSNVDNRLNLALIWTKNASAQDYFRRFVKIIRKATGME